ncbi:MBL fold metallo-hydrolase [Pseudogemmobacter humi]|uniref:Metallo-beta-lactamase superfamily protein n=1 Tax=Pseudogemmobacter humi TaxID=2483812 RepID=A0A3P5WZ50_9RHOB|nr:MBL fold metallo-hydrolase [Pseudogemmobacter humi]VDC23606.1 Metallo-beta-lactamase superfamily protein [Pseudogemmobacter humi]
MTEILHPFPEPPAAGTAIEVAPGILWLRLPLPMALDHVNVFALEDGDGWTLIDTGLHSRRMVALWERLLAGPLRGRPVRRVVVTHHHPDHIGMAGWFLARGAELLITRTAWLYGRMLTLDVEERPSPAALAFWRRAGMDEAELARRAGERPFNFADCVHPLPPGFTRLEEGQSLRIGGRDWEVRIGHGHAPAHATLWSEGIVLGGDQLLPGISANIGVWPTEPEADPLAEWLESCTRLSAFAREDQLVLPGHKLPFTGLPFRLRQMIENHISALDRLTEFLAAPRRATDCFPVLFRRGIPPDQTGLALAESVAHLNHLLRRGELSRSLGPDGAWLWQRR